MGSRVDYRMVSALRESGLEYREIAERCQCSASTVEKACRKLGLPRRSAGPQRPIDVPLLFRLWSDGVPSAEIAVTIGVCMSTLHAMRKRYGLPKRQQVRRVVTVDPTPDELEVRKRECREKHFAQRRGETDETSRIKVWRHNGGAA
ncbi:MAG: hypothetical protein WD060_10520 [Pirellulales bacterium]